MRIYIVALCVFVLSGCASLTSNRDIIEWSDGSITKITVSADGVLTVKKAGIEITADHRGRPSVIEQILGVAASSVATKAPKLSK